MKKIISAIIVFVLALSVLFGCGNTAENPVCEPNLTEVVFADRTVVYDGTEQSVEASGIPDGVKAVYANNKHADAGTYAATVELYCGDELLKTLTATLTVKKRRVTVVIDNKTSMIGSTEKLTYAVDGVIDGDDLGIELSVDTSTAGVKEIVGKANNPNYIVTFTGGKYTVTLPDVSSAVFSDKSVVYNGKTHAVTVSELPDGMTVTYKNNEHKNAGSYQAVAQLCYNGTVVQTLTATLTVLKKQATVVVDDKESMLGVTEKLTYTINGVIDGDDAGIELSVDTSKSGVKRISCVARNGNYDVTFSGGTYTVYEELMNDLDAGTTDLFLPHLAPFALKDAIFSETVITSVEFVYGGLANGYNVDSENLYMPVYVVKKDFSTAQADCTEENGKKVLLDFTGKLSGVGIGETVVADGLQIRVGADETLAFGDSQMAVLPKYKKNDSSYGFAGLIFGNKANYYNNSLIFKIVGYSTAAEHDDGKTFISFLGDSISTYTGYSNSVVYNDTIGGNAVWFPNSNYVGADMSVSETWWHKVCTRLDFDLCVNNSWSGSVVNTAQTYNVRAKNLHNKDGNRPDVIVIFMGVNDFASNTAVGSHDGSGDVPAAPYDFSGAYLKTVTTVRAAYPQSKVFCCTFLPDRKRFGSGVNGNGISETAYNDAIRAIAENTGSYLIDLYADSGITENNVSAYTVDRLHPNAAGMAMIADTVADAVQAIIN